MSRNKQIAIIGLGSFGSQLVNTLARSGVQIGALIDRDQVEEKNLSKAQFYRQDIGQYKADVLARQVANIQPDPSEIICYYDFAEDLSEADWQQILTQHAVLVLTSDSRQALQAAVKQTTAFYKQTGNSTQLVVSMGFENLAGGLIQRWQPDMSAPCPACLLSRLSYISTSDTRAVANPEDYTPDKIIHEKIGDDVIQAGLVIDVQYGIALTAALICSLLMPDQGRELIYQHFVAQPIQIWSGFRDPYLDWQSAALMGGKAQPLRIHQASACMLCA